ncbi:Lipolytic enzyme, G-D-S-L family protein [Pseudooceanicola batsensis HTCC2597]|uniref:Lipolytic enzyme, G-D-S-L family protein n=1 Tax=Pseudooceanicola batsensis (strain ATCC BAA-863 / DSM 15984 / KCTC 12145 / HTCC2597) TaxID=252305 RepID=A3U2D5_PSEBH|nr:arylesterase [Pseudooceanicola batsensis]EAQ01735.1 Lipolytic enzyme, G-D-S-L family protein [Pseudooceanicola batsensis HTCC2597]
MVLAGLLALAAPARADTTEILALGDSLTQGYGLPAAEGFVPQLQAWLDARGHDVRIVNGGVSGDTTRGGLARVDWSLTPDIDAMIVTLGGNDILRGLDPADTRHNLRGILEAGRAKGVEMLVIGIAAASNYGSDYKTAFDAIHPELAEEAGALYEPGFFAALREEGDDAGAALRYMQADGIHPNAEGVARIVDRIGPRVEDLIRRAGAADAPEG